MPPLDILTSGVDGALLRTTILGFVFVSTIKNYVCDCNIYIGLAFG